MPYMPYQDPRMRQQTQDQRGSLMGPPGQQPMNASGQGAAPGGVGGPPMLPPQGPQGFNDGGAGGPGPGGPGMMPQGGMPQMTAGGGAQGAGPQQQNPQGPPMQRYQPRPMPMQRFSPQQRFGQAPPQGQAQQAQAPAPAPMPQPQPQMTAGGGAQGAGPQQQNPQPAPAPAQPQYSQTPGTGKPMYTMDQPKVAMADGGEVLGDIALGTSVLPGSPTNNMLREIMPMADGGTVMGGMGQALQGLQQPMQPRQPGGPVQQAQNAGNSMGQLGATLYNRYKMNRAAKAVSNAPNSLGDAGIQPAAEEGMAGMDDAGQAVADGMEAMAKGGTVLSPREPQQDPGLAGSTFTEPGAAMRRYAPVSPIAPKAQLGPKPEEMGHHLPTRLRIGKRINVRLPRPSSKGLGGVKASH